MSLARRNSELESQFTLQIGLIYGVRILKEIGEATSYLKLSKSGSVITQEGQNS